MTTPSKLLKVILLGNGGVGKSCLMHRFVNNRYEENNYQTIGVEFLNKNIIVDGERYTLQIWDTAGQERFRSLRTPFYRGSDICLLTFAVNDQSSFRDLDLWRREFFYYGDVGDEVSFPFLVLGNKCDFPEEFRTVSSREAKEWCKKNGVRMSGGMNGESVEMEGVPYLETSAKDATNVELGFRRAVQLWREMDRRMESRINREQNAELAGSRAVRLRRSSSLSSNSLRPNCCS